MAKAKTSSFRLTETVTLPAGTLSGARITSELDLSAYVNVPTGQAIAIESVDYVWQNDTDYGQAMRNSLTAGGALSAQLTDLNQGGVFVRADNHSLVSSAGMNIDQTNSIVSAASDFYPDNFGTLSESRYVVNDTLYLTAGPDNANIGIYDVFCTAIVKAAVVKLGTKDWMAIAIQSTAADN